MLSGEVVGASPTRPAMRVINKEEDCMPVFYFLVVVTAIGIWFCASALFRPLGTLFRRVYRDAKEKILEEDNDEGAQKEV